MGQDLLHIIYSSLQLNGGNKLLFPLKSCCEITAIEPGFSFDMPKPSEVLGYREWDVGGGGRSLCSPCAPWPQSSWPLEYGLCGAAARLTLGGGLHWVPSFSGLPTETPGWEDADSPLGSQGLITENAVDASHTGAVRQCVERKGEEERKRREWKGGRRVNEGVERGGQAGATTVTVAGRRRCVIANHSAWEKREGVEIRARRLGVQLCGRFTSKKSGVIISSQMTALCRRIPG